MFNINKYPRQSDKLRIKNSIGNSSSLIIMPRLELQLKLTHLHYYYGYKVLPIIIRQLGTCSFSVKPTWLRLSTKKSTIRYMSLSVNTLWVSPPLSFIRPRHLGTTSSPSSICDPKCEVKKLAHTSPVRDMFLTGSTNL